jgi:hypothetical protein
MVFDVIKSSPPAPPSTSMDQQQHEDTGVATPVTPTPSGQTKNGPTSAPSTYRQPINHHDGSRPRHLFSPASERAAAAATVAGSTTSTSTPSLTASLAALTRFEIVLTPVDAYGNALSCVDTCSTPSSQSSRITNGNGNIPAGMVGNGIVRPHVPINAAIADAPRDIA